VEVCERWEDLKRVIWSCAWRASPAAHLTALAATAVTVARARVSPGEQVRADVPAEVRWAVAEKVISDTAIVLGTAGWAACGGAVLVQSPQRGLPRARARCLLCAGLAADADNHVLLVIEAALAPVSAVCESRRATLEPHAW